MTRTSAGQQIAGYLYCGETYCPACIVWILEPGATQDEQDQPEIYLERLADVWGVDRGGLPRESEFPRIITSDMLEPPAYGCDSCSGPIE
jgi:hypothetical protein